MKAVGVSNFGPKQMLKIHKYLEERGVPLASAQVRIFLCKCQHLMSFLLSFGTIHVHRYG